MIFRWEFNPNYVNSRLFEFILSLPWRIDWWHSILRRIHEKSFSIVNGTLSVCVCQTEALFLYANKHRRAITDTSDMTAGPHQRVATAIRFYYSSARAHTLIWRIVQSMCLTQSRQSEVKIVLFFKTSRATTFQLCSELHRITSLTDQKV